MLDLATLSANPLRGDALDQAAARAPRDPAALEAAVLGVAPLLRVKVGRRVRGDGLDDAEAEALLGAVAHLRRRGHDPARGRWSTIAGRIAEWGALAYQRGLLGDPVHRAERLHFAGSAEEPEELALPDARQVDTRDALEAAEDARAVVARLLPALDGFTRRLITRRWGLAGHHAVPVGADAFDLDLPLAALVALDREALAHALAAHRELFPEEHRS